MPSLLLSCSVMSDSLQPHGLQRVRLPCPSPSPRACSNPCPLSRWCHPTISSSIVPFSSCLQSFPASGSLPISWLFTSGGQRTRASASVLPMNIQGWFPLGWFNLLAVQWTLTLKRVFSNTTVQKHQFSLICGPVLLHLCDYWQNHSFNYMDLCWQSNVSAF